VSKRIDCTLTDAQYEAVRDALARGAADMDAQDEPEDRRLLRSLGRACRKMFAGEWEPVETRGQS
jgi:hypothetical protein